MKWIAGLLVFVAFAGCSDGAAESEEHKHHAGSSEFGGDTSQVTEAPTWALGDWWTYKTLDGSTQDLVVAADQGSNWLLATNDPGAAWFDYMFDVSFLGPMSKSNLAGQQNGQTIKFFEFPLEHNKDWNTNWDGESRHVVAHAASGGKWHIIVHAGAEDMGDKFAEYVYDPAVGFFDSITFYNTTDGSAQYGLELQNSGSAFTGEVFRYADISNAFEVDAIGPANSLVMTAIEIGDDVAEMYLDWEMDCATTGQALFAFQEPGPDGSITPLPPLPLIPSEAYGNDQPCPNVNQPDEPIQIDPPVPGTWRWDSTVQGDGHLRAWIEIRIRETFSF